MFVDTTKPQAPASSSLAVDYLALVLCGHYSDYSEDQCSAQYFHGVAPNADIGNAVPFPRCPDMHFAWTTALDALLNRHLLVTICDAVLHHPTGSTACRRSGGWIFATVKKHSSSSFQPAVVPFRAKEVEKVCTTTFQKIRCLDVTK